MTVAIRISRSSYGDSGISTNANQVLTNISNRLRRVMDEADNISEKVAREFANEAQQKLSASGYNVENYVDNIEWRKSRDKKYWTVGFKDNDEKDIMYYLEYGTGFVGENNPHPEASARGWDYAINRDEDWYFDMTKPVGQQGLYSLDAPTPQKGTKGWIFRDDDGQLIATSGLRAISYMYDTLQNADQIKERAIRESKIKSIIKGGR